MNLRSRLNRIYGDGNDPSQDSSSAETPSSQELRSRLSKLPGSRLGRMEEYLGGNWIEGLGGRILRADRRYPVKHLQGQVELAQLMELDAEPLKLLAADPRFQQCDPRRMLFIDTETTGLAGGAGTYIFLIGVGFLQQDGFRLRQFFLPDYSSEKALLEELDQLLAAGAEGPFSHLVSFNGKSYDLSLLSNRFILQRMADPFEGMPHLDLIHPCRTLWKGRLESCSLQSLERHVLGFRRSGDIPGHLIPQTYFSYLRTGRFQAFADVFEHNRLDILSMVALLATAAAVVTDPVRFQFADPLSAARLHQLRGGEREAAAILESALREDPDCDQRLDWVRELALLTKRLGRHSDSLLLWRGLLQEHPDPGEEAFEECAKILEHQIKDLRAALSVVRRGLQRHPHNPSLSHRQHRLECKIAGKRWW